jgi:hypothetical protein
MTLSPCVSCRRHVRDDIAACPFCGAATSVAPAPEEAPRLVRGALMTFASASFAATLGACYGGAPMHHQGVNGPPSPPPPQTIMVEGDAVAVYRRAIVQARANGCTVAEVTPQVADVSCTDLNVRISPTTSGAGGGIELLCREPLEKCRSGVEKLISPTPAIEPIPPPP